MFINSVFSLIQNSSSSFTRFLTDNTQKYAKIGVVALAIFSALAACFFIFRCYQAKKIEPLDTDVPPDLFPKTVKDNNSKPVSSPSFEKKNQPKKEEKQTKLPQIPSSSLPIVKPAKPKKTENPSLVDQKEQADSPSKPVLGKSKSSLEEEDAELARKLQEHFLAEDLHESTTQPPKTDRTRSKSTVNSSTGNTSNTDLKEQEEDDAALAKKLQQQFLTEDFTPPQNLTQDSSNASFKQVPTKQKPASLSSVVDHTIPPPPTEPIRVKNPDSSPAPDQPSPFIEVEKICGQAAEKIFTDPHFSVVQAFSKIDLKTQKYILSLLDELVIEFERRHPPSQKIKYGDSVPAYFANVADDRENERKYWSLIGIRNVLLYGPGIVDDFRKQKFLGGEHHYTHNQGLQAFKIYTGTVVDLDTELDAKKTTNDQEALAQAKKLIVLFGKTYGLQAPSGQELTAEEVARQMPNRKLDLPDSRYGQAQVHYSDSNVDRSNHGVWKRVIPGNNGKMTYFVNVPVYDTVLIATLNLPYMIAELTHRVKERNKGIIPQKFFDDFFMFAISTKCFNDKVRQFKEFYLSRMAQLDQLPSPEESAIQAIKKGSFGEILRLKDPEVVLKEAYNRATLMQLFDSLDKGEHEINHRSTEGWIEEEMNGFVNKLKAKGLWEKTLYQSEQDQEYFLLNQNTLKLFLKDYYIYLKSI